MRRRPRRRPPLPVAEWGPHRAAYELQKAVAEERMAEFDELPADFRTLVNAIGLARQADIDLIYELYQKRVTNPAQAEAIKSLRALKRIEESAETFGF